MAFQFTHPGKGATGGEGKWTEVERVSIHAPWEGCDAVAVLYFSMSPRFQFTHPGKGATPRDRAIDGAPCFNSRTLGRVRHECFGGSPRH